MSFSLPGGHVNPAISLGFAVVGKLSLRQLPFYAIAQCCGAFTASVTIFGVYYGKYIKTSTKVTGTRFPC